MPKFLLALFGLLLLVATSTVIQAEDEPAKPSEGEKTVPLDQVPKLARKALLMLAGSATIESVTVEEMEDEDDEEDGTEEKHEEGDDDEDNDDDEHEDDDDEREIMLYEATWKVDGVEHEATVTAAGDLVETEQAVTGDAVPKPVAAAVKAFGKSSKIKIVQKMIVVYELEMLVDGKEKEVLVLPSGQRVEVETADEDDYEEENEEKGKDESGDSQHEQGHKSKHKNAKDQYRD